MATPPRSLTTDRRRSPALAPLPGPIMDGRHAPSPNADQIRATEVFSKLPPRLIYDTAKRIFDLVAAVALIVLAIPPVVVLAVILRLDSPGPVFIRQERLGKDARPFRMFKFRSMRINSDQLPSELLSKNESSGPLFKMRNDPRITRVGRLLRRGSIDELPQLLNVLTGEMSLVGPRPPLARELEGFDAIQQQRLRVRPGLTGLWQVSGLSNLPFEEMVRLDLLYIRKRSFLYDLNLLIRTVPSVLLCRGAY